jgi:hypothetical protein
MDVGVSQMADVPACSLQELVNLNAGLGFWRHAIH